MIKSLFQGGNLSSAYGEQARIINETRKTESFIVEKKNMNLNCSKYFVVSATEGHKVLACAN